MNDMTLGERLKTLRGAKSQADFGKELNISQPTVRNYENNERLPDADFIKNVCNKFRITADWLLFGKEPCADKSKSSQPEIPIKTGIHVAEKAPMSGACIRCKQLDEKLDKATEKADTANERLYEALRENSDLKERIGNLTTELAALKKCDDADDDDGETEGDETEPPALVKAS